MNDQPIPSGRPATSAPPPTRQPEPAAPPPRRGAARARWVLLLILLAALGAGAAYWYLTRNQVTTDDAFTDGNAVMVAPQVSGTVVALEVSDNQPVTAGQVLLKIDPRAYQAARDEAAGNLAVAHAQLADAQARLASARIVFPARLADAQAQLAAAQATEFKARTDLRRQQHLPKQATTQQALDDAEAAMRSADAQVAQARASLRSADTVQQSVEQAEAQVRQLQGQVELAKARLAQAQLNLDWTVLRAPQAGWVTKRNVNQGNYVTPGQALMSLVTSQVWITANFKEADLARMRRGQKVAISVDAYPSLHLEGHVDSIQLGSGSRFSAFPVENATGNFVKVVQRVPVKIVIDSGLDPNIPLPLGLSVEPTIYLK
ncbi:MAG TPA: HlyD family secretion protein [Acetobacteraceae bacterium]|nr:HlyD family secretion protein [Acetobacteraceae bacterium]